MAQRELRLWPGVAVVLLQWLVRFVLPMIWPETVGIGVIGGLVGGLAVLVWWAFFSRAPRLERWGAVGLMIVSLAATSRILHVSIATGMMGMMFVIYSVPVVSLALVAWAVASRRLTGELRLVTLSATILIACGGWALLRTDGITADAHSQFAWRWAETPEQKLLARGGELPAQSAPARVSGDWPGFRGAHRDDIVNGVRIKTDWAAAPPVELWRRAVGPGWSSFAVHDGLLYTQEQRGDFEVVACYSVATGKPVWAHRDAARFWESNAGAGPRGTATLRDGRVYTFGATGILNALDAGSGAVVWVRNAASDAKAKVPEWGFASSPLVVDDMVIVAAAGRLAAYDLVTGHPRWLGPTGGGSYSSPQLLTIGGVPQVLLLSDAGVTSVAPADGRVLWKHAWRGFAILQPAQTEDGGVLLVTGSAAGGIGTLRLAVTQGSGGWSAKEVWMSSGLKPYFNDFVIHDGYAYGFDGGILACISLQDGSRKWKGGRYGHGQLLLLNDQSLLLVLSEQGELALVSAAPDKFREIARFRAMEGKTWNHPVLAGDILLVRNGLEMAAFRLALVKG
jgi:outer membrane protein assembly factor BamB